MALLKKKRAEEVTEPQGDVVLASYIPTTEITEREALAIPTVSGAIEYIGNIISQADIKLYKEQQNDSEDMVIKEVKGDKRVKLLTEDTGDTLLPADMLKAVASDYYLYGEAYIYIEKDMYQNPVSLRYVDRKSVSILATDDPIFKTYSLNVYGKTYYEEDFIRVLRNTKNGATGAGLLDMNSQALETAYNTMTYENNLIKKGGNKKGFITSPKSIPEQTIAKIKQAFRKLYSNQNEDNVIVLSGGAEFKEASSTSVEMQLNENKQTNANELCKLFGFSPELLRGKGEEKEIDNMIKFVINAFLNNFVQELNRKLLKEKEKADYYFAADTRELAKGTMKERFEAYKTGIDANVLQIDEARYLENLEPLGLQYIKLGLADVLYDPKTKDIYTANTNKKTNIDSAKAGE